MTWPDFVLSAWLSHGGAFVFEGRYLFWIGFGHRKEHHNCLGSPHFDRPICGISELVGEASKLRIRSLKELVRHSLGLGSMLQSPCRLLQTSGG